MNWAGVPPPNFHFVVDLGNSERECSCTLLPILVVDLRELATVVTRDSDCWKQLFSLVSFSYSGVLVLVIRPTLAITRLRQTRVQSRVK